MADTGDGDASIELRALLMRRRRGIEALLAAPEIRGAEESVLWPLAWRLGVFLHDLDGAERIYRLLAEPGRSDYSRALGLNGVAWLALGRGRFREARAALAELPSAWHFQEAALAARVLIATHPLSRRSDDTLRALADSIRAALRGLQDRVVGLYLLAALDAARGADAAARSLAREIAQAPPADLGLGREHARLVEALVAARSQPGEAGIAAFEGAQIRVWFGVAVTGLLRAQTYERFLRAELLRAAGRDQEALGWYTGFVEGAPPDLAYLGPAHLRLAEILERQGLLEEARAQYARFVALWRDCDPELRPSLILAQGRLTALAAANGRH